MIWFCHFMLSAELSRWDPNLSVAWDLSWLHFAWKKLTFPLFFLLLKFISFCLKFLCMYLSHFSMYSHYKISSSYPTVVISFHIPLLLHLRDPPGFWLEMYVLRFSFLKMFVFCFVFLSKLLLQNYFILFAGYLTSLSLFYAFDTIELGLFQPQILYACEIHSSSNCGQESLNLENFFSRTWGKTSPLTRLTLQLSLII